MRGVLSVPFQEDFFDMRNVITINRHLFVVLRLLFLVAVLKFF